MNEFNAGDRKAIQKRNKEVAKWKREAQQVVQDLMSTQYGRRWVWEKLALAQVFAVNSNKDTVLFSEGQRSIGNALMVEVIEACPELYIQAMREANARANTRTDPGTDPNADTVTDAESFPDSDADDNGRRQDAASADA